MVILSAACAWAQGADREWNTYQPGDCTCYIQLPANPEYQTQSVDSTAIHIYTAKDMTRTPAFVYTVSFGEYPKEKISDAEHLKKTLEGDRDGFAKSVNGKLLTDKAATLGKWPVRIFTYSGEDGLARYILREIIIENRIFQLVVCVPKDKTEDPDIAKFFESFRLPKK